MLTFFPLMVLVTIFRKTRNPNSKFGKLKSLISATHNFKAKPNKNKFTFPCWCKKVLFLISFLIMIMSLGLTVAKGKTLYITFIGK